MKKVFALIAIVGFVACNNAEVKVEAVDSTKIKDSLAAAAKMAAPKVDSPAAPKVDSPKMAAPAKMTEAPKK